MAVLVSKSSITWKTRGLNCYTEVSLQGVQQEIFFIASFVLLLNSINLLL
jgi:hypothetical protein